jgi:hypothetical protein
VPYGLVHVLQLPPSTRHSKLEPPSDELKSNVGVVSFDGFAGPESTVVCGAMLSTRWLATTSLLVCPTGSVATARMS